MIDYNEIIGKKYADKIVQHINMSLQRQGINKNVFTKQFDESTICICYFNTKETTCIIGIIDFDDCHLYEYASETFAMHKVSTPLYFLNKSTLLDICNRFSKHMLKVS